MASLRKTVLLLTLFSVAMGFLEASVVVYLRQLYYPKGFQFPLVPIPSNIALVEFLREAATLIMLFVIGVIAGRNTSQRFSFFLFCFAVWDIFYYLSLRALLSWPESLFTNDILFVIPVPWVGPVLAPCLVSLTMIAITLCVIYFHERDITVTINRREWLLFLAGSIVIIISFTKDYMQYVLLNGDTSVWTPMSNQGLFSEVSKYMPPSFSWPLFLAGELLLCMGIWMMVNRHRHGYNPQTTHH